MDDPTVYDSVNPYDPPEKQALEDKLDHDKHEQHDVHAALVAEQHLSDTLHETHNAPHTDARIQELELDEQKVAVHIVEDQQAIAHWDHDHPDGGYNDDPSAGDAGDTTSDASSGDGAAGDNAGAMSSGDGAAGDGDGDTDG